MIAGAAIAMAAATCSCSQTVTPQAVAAGDTSTATAATTSPKPLLTAPPTVPSKRTTLTEKPALGNTAGRDSICANVEEFRAAWEEFMDEPMSTPEAAAAKVEQYREALNAGQMQQTDFDQIVALVNTC